MRLYTEVTTEELPGIIAYLAAYDVEEMFISDDRGGTGCWILIVQSPFVPALPNDLMWTKAPAHWGHMIDEDASFLGAANL